MFTYVLEFMLTFDEMQNTNSLMCTKFEILGQSNFKAIQAFHTVRIVLYIGCSGPVVECLNKINIQNYAYSMKSLNNFQTALASVFEFFFTLKYCFLVFKLKWT